MWVTIPANDTYPCACCYYDHPTQITPEELKGLDLKLYYIEQRISTDGQNPRKNIVIYARRAPVDEAHKRRVKPDGYGYICDECLRDHASRGRFYKNDNKFLD